MIYSNDFSAYKTLVWKLSQFLEFLGFEIICDFLDPKASTNSYHWVRDSLEEADKVRKYK